MMPSVWVKIRPTVFDFGVGRRCRALAYLAYRYWGNPQKRNFFTGLVAGII